MVPAGGLKGGASNILWTVTVLSNAKLILALFLHANIVILHRTVRALFWGPGAMSPITTVIIAASAATILFVRRPAHIVVFGVHVSTSAI